ncbi:hypothetical protein BHE90_015012 [Fusarium euwallaceae]|uniref:C2H2-type domain-containing protein n=1 Tax=Fusarium euwallaceae TaxID=1147111 RepID=A0A430L4B9_9HYPO|nr:hypothetical protein BHE90_015012 [Fusarium euwallaceae]
MRQTRNPSCRPRKRYAACLNTPPDGRQLEMFFQVVHKAIRGQGPNGAIAYDYYENGLAWIRKWCVFQYKGFKLDQHDSSRIKETLQQLWLEGILTKEVIREKHWITSDMIDMMLRAMLQDGIQNGTLSWDVLIMKALSLLLQCVVGARAGEIRRSHQYQGLECLRWEHIYIVLDTSNNKNLFRATIDLVFVKGSTNNPGRARSVEVEEFDDPSLNCLCPIKLLLCHALRTGAVYETSWAELRQAARERPSKGIIWAYPERPVICAIAGNSDKLVLDRPSPVASAQATLTQAAQLIGIVAKVKTHDIRRGAARQSAHLEHSIAGSAIEQARIAIGHSHSSRDNGETEDYVGDLDDHNWTNRAKQKLRQTAKHQLILAPEPYNPKRKRTTQEINEVCREMGLDPDDKNDRFHASYRSRNALYDEWIASERVKADIRVPQNTAQVKPGSGSDANKETHPSLSLGANASRVGQTRSSASNSDPSVPRGLIPPPNGHQPATHGGGDEEEKDEQHPLETLGAQALHDYIFDGEAESLTNTDEIASVFAQGVEAISSSVAGNILDSEPKTFSDFFASVNVYRWESTVLGLPSCANQTGSKEAPTRFMHQCAVTHCGRTFVSRAQRDAHSVNCQADVAIFFEFACSICGKKYPTEKKLNVHMTEHNWTPRTCSFPNCQDETVYQTRNQFRAHAALAHHDLPTACWLCGAKHGIPSSLKRHIRERHPEVTEEELDNIMPNQKRQAHKKDAFKPQRCSFPDCTYQTVFASRSQYRDHLKNHGVKGSTLDQYVQDNPEELRPTTPPRVRAANFVPQRCNHPDCSCRQTFGHRHKLAAHLLEYHGVWKDEDIALNRICVDITRQVGACFIIGDIDTIPPYTSSKENDRAQEGDDGEAKFIKPKVF